MENKVVIIWMCCINGVVVVYYFKYIVSLFIYVLVYGWVDWWIVIICFVNYVIVK